MNASQTLRAPPSNAAPSEYGSNQDGSPKQKDQGNQLPTDTLAILGVLSDEVLDKLRAVTPPQELRGLTDPELLSTIVNYFSSGEIATQVARISDKALWKTAQALDKDGESLILTLHDFAKQYFDPEGKASKSMLIQSVGELLGELSRVHDELQKLLMDAKIRESEPPKLEQPAISTTSRCEVLGQSEGDQEWEPGEARTLELRPLPKPYSIAQIVDRSNDIDPHAHLLVDAHYAVTADGLLRPVSVPELPPSSSHWLGDSSIKLRFDRDLSGGEVPEIPRFSVTESSNHTEVTYTEDPEKEEDYEHSPWNPDRAEICAPDIFTKLVEKFDELDCSDEEKAQLVAQVFRSQNLIYSRDDQVAELVAACNPRHRLSLTLGLSIGDCTLLSAVLQQLLAHADVNAVVEAGAICSADGESYERPGHARVKVYGSRSILRLDPTIWCVQNISVHPIENDKLEVLKEELLNANAETYYKVGQRARKLLTTPPWERSDAHGDSRNPDITDHTGSQFCSNSKSEHHQPQHGHRLSDDFDRKTQVELYRLLASNEQDLLVAEVWTAYQELLESATETGDIDLRTLFNEQIAVILEKEVELVGLENSKICSVLPQMLQTLARRTDIGYGCFYDEIGEFFGAIDSLKVRTTLLVRALDPYTLHECAFALMKYCELTVSSDSARFLARLVRMLDKDPGSFGFYENEDGDMPFHQELILLAAKFPKEDRDGIIEAYAESSEISIDTLAGLLCWRWGNNHLYSPLTLPREVLSSIFPALIDSPIEVAEKVFAAQDRRFFHMVGGSIEQSFAALLILSQYFPAHVHPQLKPLVTAYVVRYLRDYGNKSVDFRSNPAVSELCDLVHINDKMEQLERQDFWKPYYLYIGSCDGDSGRLLPQYEAKHHFIRGYLLKELSALGLLDVDEIADCLYIPSLDQIKAAFDDLHLDIFLRPAYPGFKDGPKTRKAAELGLAILAESSRKGVTVPHADLLRDAVDSGLVNQATLGLAMLVLIGRELQFNEAMLETAIPDAVAYLFSIQDSLRLRSYVRIKTACSLLKTGELLADSTLQATERINQVLLNDESILRAQDSAYLNLARVYINTDSCLLALDRDHHRFQSNSGPVRDGLSSIATLHWAVHFARGSIAHQNIPDDDRERSQQIVLSLLNQFPPHSQDSPTLTRAHRVPSHIWQDQVAKSLRIQRSEGGARVLRRISQSRNENFDSNRAYVQGDDLRAIDWRVSARRDGLVVRSYQKSSQSIADSSHVLVDLADLVEPPQFGFFTTRSNELKMSKLALDPEVMTSIANFMHSLAGEGKQVRLSVFAFGAVMVDAVVSTGRGSLQSDLSARTRALEALSDYALSYTALCFAAQCVPNAYSLVGLMNPHERTHFANQVEPSGLVIHLHGKASAESPIDPALKELESAGRAVRVHL